MSQDGQRQSQQPDDLPEPQQSPLPEQPRSPIRPDEVHDVEAGIVAEDRTRLAGSKAQRPEPIRPGEVRDAEAGILAEDRTRLAPIKAVRPAPIRPDDVRDQQAGLSSDDQTRLAPRPEAPAAGTASSAIPPAPAPSSGGISAVLNDVPAGSSHSSAEQAWTGSQWGNMSGSSIGSSLGGTATSQTGGTAGSASTWGQARSDRSGTRYSRPVDRYAIPDEEVDAPKQKLNLRALLIGLVGLIIFGIVVGFVYVRFIRTVTPPPDIIVNPSVSGSAGERIAAPEDVVRKYLRALADGDVTTAISLGSRSPGEMVAITPQAYAKSLQSHPITDISVPRQDNVSSFVAASYKIGDQQVDTRFRVVRDDDGGWRLAHSTIEFKFNYRSAENLPLRLNGEPLSGTTAALLPGSYSIDTGLPFIDFSHDNRVTISNLEYEGTVQRTLTPALTAEGSKILMQAGRNSLQACLNSGSLNPVGCPNQMHAAAPYEPSSVKWRVLDDPFANTSAALDINRTTWGQASVLLRFEVSFTYTDGTTSGTQRPTPLTASFGADMGVTDQAAVKVVWS